MEVRLLVLARSNRNPSRYLHSEKADNPVIQYILNYSLSHLYTVTTFILMCSSQQHHDVPSFPLLLCLPSFPAPSHSITVPGCGALISLLRFKPSTFLGVPLPWPVAILLALPLRCLICSNAASLLIPPGVAGVGLKKSSDLRGMVTVVVVSVVW